MVGPSGDSSGGGSSYGNFAFDEALFEEAVAGQANNYGHEGVH